MEQVGALPGILEAREAVPAFAVRAPRTTALLVQTLSADFAAVAHIPGYPAVALPNRRTPVGIARAALHRLRPGGGGSTSRGEEREDHEAQHC